jgi:hypothetical protein
MALDLAGVLRVMDYGILTNPRRPAKDRERRQLA